MDVTAIVRSENKRPRIDHHALTTIVGDPCDPTFLASVFSGQDVVISTLGGRRPTNSATSVYYRSASAIVKAADGKDLERVLVISTALLFPSRTLFEKVLRLVARANVRSAFLIRLY